MTHAFGRKLLAAAALASAAVAQAQGVVLAGHMGEVELSNVSAMVLPTAMPYVLLGNSRLGRFQMRRVDDVMRLELR